MSIARWIEAVEAVLLVKVRQSEVTMALSYPPLSENRPQKELDAVFAYPFSASKSLQRPWQSPRTDERRQDKSFMLGINLFYG